MNFKRIVLFFILPISILLFLVNCNINIPEDKTPADEKDSFTIATQPEADPADDNVNTGVYKGVVSSESFSGTYKILIGNTTISNISFKKVQSVRSTQSVTLEIIVNGKKYTITGTETDNGDGTFTYSFSSKVDGHNFVFSITIQSNGVIIDNVCQLNGEEIPAEVFKETSTILVMCFEGTADVDGDASKIAVWNMLIKDTKLGAVWSWNDSNMGSGFSFGDYDNSTGIIDNINTYNIYGNLLSSDTGTGTISGNLISGTWNVSSSTGTFSGSRTL